MSLPEGKHIVNDLYYSIYNFYTAIVVVGLAVAWINPRKKDYQFFKKIHITLISGQVFLGVVGIFVGDGFDFISIAIPVISLYIKKQKNETALKIRKSDASSDSLKRKATSRGKLITWLVVFGIVFAGFIFLTLGGVLEGEADASMTAPVLIILLIAIILSYLKYSRSNQADLIANAIKSNTQPSTSSTDSTSGVPQAQNTEDRLRKLESLLSNKLVSQEEYEQKKKQIIDSI